MRFSELEKYIQSNTPEAILSSSLKRYFQDYGIEISEDIVLNELCDKYDHFDLRETNTNAQYFMDNISDIKENIKKYSFVYHHLLQDEDSKRTFLNMMLSKVFIDLRYIELAYKKVNTQYFDPEIFNFTEEEVYIDCGAYTGDSAEDFIKSCPGYKKIYLYEAIPDIIKICERKLEKYNFDKTIDYKNFAVYSSQCDLNFSLESLSGDSKINEEGVKVKAVSLDQEHLTEKITFIKMDIEGSESEALRGAKNIIKNNIPKLAVCIYHKPDDFWRIPLLIFNMVPNAYEYKVRQFRYAEYYDTILYCIPKINKYENNIVNMNPSFKKLKIVANNSEILIPEEQKYDENIKVAEKWFRRQFSRSREFAQKLKRYNDNLLEKIEEKDKENEIIGCKLNDYKVEQKQLIQKIGILNKENDKLSSEIELIKNENNALQLMIEDNEEKISEYSFVQEQLNIVKNQNIYYGNKIEEILHYRSLSKLFYLHAILGKYKRENFNGKLKIIIKFLMRSIGIKKNFYIDEYRADFQISNLLHYINHNYNLLPSEKKYSLDNTSEKYKSRKIESDINNIIESQLEDIIDILPKVSILMPVYNHAGFVEEAINSILLQTYSNWELIILNDGSTDNLLEILEKYNADPRIRLYTQDNQRLPNGLSNLHELAMGEYITWTSADNIMEKEMLYELVTYLVKNPMVDMVYADVIVIDEDGNKLTAGYREYNCDPKNPEIIRLPRIPEVLNKESDNFINACFMYKKLVSDVLQGEYSADLEGLEDYDYWLKIQKIGRIEHIRNLKPLYRYRVHKNTMSEDLLQNKANEHMERAKKLIQYDLDRENYVNKLWNFEVMTSQSTEKDLIRVLSENGYIDHNSEKVVKIIDKSQIDFLEASEVGVLIDDENYILYRNDDKPFNIIELKKEIEINPLSKKARYIHIKGLYWEYPAQFLGYPVIGGHCDIRNIDLERTIQYIELNNNILFVLAAYPNTEDKKIIETIQKECENFVYVGEKEIGECYYYYASWNMMFLPPQKEYGYKNIMYNILLAWNIGRWLLLEDSNKKIVLPFITYYNFKEKEFGLLDVIDLDKNEKILEQYISYFSKDYRMKMLIRYLNGFTMQAKVNRPCFGEIKRQRQKPKKVQYIVPNFKNMDSSKYIGILVDSLDKGGLEQVVKFLAERLRERNANIKILCTTSGGHIAKELEALGFDVLVFENDEKKFKEYLKKNPPLLINTHYTKKFLDIVHSLNIPIIEVIHNMYVFLNEKDWERQRKNEKYFTKMIAVSELVKDIYVKKHGDINPEKITVIGNSANVKRVVNNSRKIMREKLGIPDDAIVFINVSSIDGRKNQLGLISAFEEVYNRGNNNIYLICVGNILSEFYYHAILQLQQQSMAKDNIFILEYYQEIGQLLNMADVFVLDSYFEGWSIAATEAVFAGLPLIHSNCGSGKELTFNGEHGILVSNPKENIEEMSVEQLMKDINRTVSDNNAEVVQAMEEFIKNIEIWQHKKSYIKFNSYLHYCDNNMINLYINEFKSLIGERENG